MARTVRLDVLRTRLRQRTDTENETSRFPDAEMNDCINEGIAKLHALILTSFGQGSFEGNTIVTTVVGQELYTLPATFLWLKKVWMYIDGEERVLLDYNEYDTDGMATQQGWNWYVKPMFRLQGDSISFRPTPNSVQTISLRYMPSAVRLASDSDTLDGIDGFEEYALAWAGKRVAMKNRDQLLMGQFDSEMASASDTVRAVHRLRNATAAPRMTDVYATDRAYRFRRSGRWWY